MDFMKETVPQNVQTKTDRHEGLRDIQVMYSSPANDGTQLSMSKKQTHPNLAPIHFNKKREAT